MTKGRILLVEDDWSLGFVTRDNIAQAGYDVRWAKDGMIAWRVFRENDFDLCLLDVMLPAMDGFELAKRIREINESVPVIFLTARNMGEDKCHGFEIGGDDYLTKPFSVKELLYRIAVFMKRGNTAVQKAELITLGSYRLDVLNLQLLHQDTRISLTPMERDLLKMLATRKDTLVRRGRYWSPFGEKMTILREEALMYLYRD